MSKQRHPEGWLEDLVAAKSNPINLNALVAEMLTAFGGLTAFCNLAFATFEELPAKSPSRERMLSNVMRLIAQATIQPPAQEANEEELRAILEQLADGNGDDA
jgi:hypothetical protein